MPRTFPILALFVLLVPAPTVLAGPPEGASGKMVFDEVAEGLRRCSKEADPEKRFRRLDKLAESHDPRVDVILGEMLAGPYGHDVEIACRVILRHHFTSTVGVIPVDVPSAAASG